MAGQSEEIGIMKPPSQETEHVGPGATCVQNIRVCGGRCLIFSFFLYEIVFSSLIWCSLLFLSYFIFSYHMCIGIVVLVFIS